MSEKIIKSHIAECLIEQGYKDSCANIDKIYKAHLNDIENRHYNTLIHLHGFQLEEL